MRRNAAPSFAALATVLVTMLVLGVFIPIVQATNGAANSVRSRVLVDVYLRPTATDADVARVKRELLAVRNSLTPPASGGATKPLDPAIENVSNKKNDTRKILEVTNLVTITAAVLTVLLTLASVLLIANTIRLSLYARRREVEVMKLVGATDWFIRWPFVIEGVFVGALGALLAIFVLGVTKVALLDPLANHWTLIAAPRTIAFTALVAVLLCAGVLVSALGSGLSLRRFLRV